MDEEIFSDIKSVIFGCGPSLGMFFRVLCRMISFSMDREHIISFIELHAPENSLKIKTCYKYKYVMGLSFPRMYGKIYFAEKNTKINSPGQKEVSRISELKYVFWIYEVV